MLTSIELNDKSFDELFAEALAQIPLYSEEWTNFNISDPGITVLQNLTAFNLLQQEDLSTVTDALRRRLLQLVGYSAHNNVPATVLVQAPGDKALSLPANYSVQAGSLTFENTRPVTTQLWSVKAVYTGRTNDYKDVTRLLDPKSSSAAFVFGDPPAVGNGLYCILEGEPEPGSVLRFWAQSHGDNIRTPFNQEDDQPVFAQTRWQYYTAAGWTDLDFTDGTHCFLTDGEICLTLGDEPMALFPETDIYGMAVRCLLLHHDYDVSPRLSSLSGNLFPMQQLRTACATYRMPGADTVTVSSALAAQGNIFVYCREAEDGDYYAYREASPSIKQYGRFYTRDILEDGVCLHFDRSVFGFGPTDGEEAVLICCYDSEMLHHRALGPVYGYENQEMEVELVSSLVPERISVLAELPAKDDEPPAYRLIFPDCEDERELCYSVLCDEAKLIIRHPSYDGTYNIFLADCVTTRGALGNIRPGATLSRMGGYDGTDIIARYAVPSSGFGGVSYETPEQLRSRFTRDMSRVGTAVTAEDYEALAKSTPGLSVHKVKAVIFPKENLVKLVVKPYTKDERSSLSPLYIRQLTSYLEQRRMLTTRIDLISPRYVRVDVAAKVFVQPHFERAEAEIETLLRRSLDYVTTDVPFGSWIRFSEIYDALCALPCVVRVDSLRLIPEDRRDVTISSSDMKLSDRALCYPGEIRLELNTFTQKSR